METASKNINRDAYDFVWRDKRDHIALVSEIIPFLRHELILNLGDKFEVNNAKNNRKVVFSPIQFSPIRTEVEGKYNAFGLFFNPWGIYQTYGISMAEFQSERSDDRILFDKKEFLIQQLEGNLSWDAKLMLFADHFDDHSKGKRIPDIVASFFKAVITAHNSTPEIQKIARDLRTSPQYLIANFKTITGFTPKKMLQLIQIHKALNLMNHLPGLSLTQVGLESGFYDQAHFIRIFKRFSGMTPKNYLRLQMSGKVTAEPYNQVDLNFVQF